ncbi:MAG: hypothetical protein LBV00_09625, partial [Propionibacteriaceae bacterium]|nr:hypothetical protein [Propionibacteriaceae bacterium]
MRKTAVHEFDATGQSRAARRRQTAQRGSSRLGIGFVGPFVLLYLVFVVYPVVQAVIMSFHEWDLLGSVRRFIGLGNYVQMLGGVGVIWSPDHLVIWRALILVIAGI